jgi:dTDP-4-dehydrorhamnose reductase
MTAAAEKGRSLIIGASGQVGWQIFSRLGPERAVGSSRETGPPGWVSLDLGSPAGLDAMAREIIAELDVAAVYCVGGMTDVERCESEPGLAMRINCHGPAVLASAAAAQGVPFVYFSTEYVFDGKSGPYAEDAPAAPINAYGRSKWMGELAVRSAHPASLIIRTTVVYGPDPGGRNFLYGLRRALQAGQTMRVASDQISTPTYNRDLASVAIALVQAGASGVFHVCGAERLSRLEFARRAARAMGLDSSRIVGTPTAELGQVAPRPLEAGLSTEKLRRHSWLPAMRGIEGAVREWAEQSRFEAQA